MLKPCLPGLVASQMVRLYGQDVVDVRYADSDGSTVDGLSNRTNAVTAAGLAGEGRTVSRKHGQGQSATGPLRRVCCTQCDETAHLECMYKLAYDVLQPRPT